MAAAKLGDSIGYIERRTALPSATTSYLPIANLHYLGVDPDCESAWHLYVIGWNEQALGISRGDAFAAMRAAGIGVQVHYIPVHLHPYFHRLGFRSGQFPSSEAHYERAITIPLYAAMTHTQQDTVVQQILTLVHSVKGRRVI